MKKLSKITLLTLSLATCSSLLSTAQGFSEGEIITNTFKGNHLFTSKFELNNPPTRHCNAVVISPKAALTSGDCVDFKSEKKFLGYVYPALSGRLDPLSYMQITEGLFFKEDAWLNGQGIGLVKWDKLATSYLKNNAPKIKVIDDLGELKDKPVYSISYPRYAGNNYQVIHRGKVLNTGHNIITSDIASSTYGRAGAGLFLQETNELIGILTSIHGENTNFVPISTNVNAWIEKNKS